MQSVLDKIKLKAFLGELDIHGTLREVEYVSSCGECEASLMIRGLKFEDALHVLESLRGGLLKDADAVQPAPSKPKEVVVELTKRNLNGVEDASPTLKGAAKAARGDGPTIDFAKKAQELKESKAKIQALVHGKEQEQLVLPKTEAVAHGGGMAGHDDDIDESDDEAESDIDTDQGPQPLDIPAMMKMEKLRPLIEHMVSKGYNTTEKIVTCAQRLRLNLPCLKLLDAKGDFDKRMDRAASVVLAGEPS